MRHGGLVMPDWWTEFRYLIHLSRRPRGPSWSGGKAFEEEFGRSYGGLMEYYQREDADAILVTLPAAGTAKEWPTASAPRKEGGVAKLRVFRPFPARRSGLTR